MKQQSRFDLLVFDWDGTLFDSTALIARSIQGACADLGLAVPSMQQASYVIGLGLSDALAHVAPSLPGAQVQTLCERYQVHYQQQVRMSHQEVTLFEGVESMLHELKNRQFFLAVATGKSRKGLDEALKIGHLLNVFDATRTADETRSKPNPQMMYELMQELSVSPERTLLIGDTTHDLQMAINANTASLGVSYGAHETQALRELKPLCVVHSVAQLSAWLVLEA